MRRIWTVLPFVLFTIPGCMPPQTLPDVSARPPEPASTIDGLTQVKLDRPGEFFVREDHGIGGYDSIVIASGFMNYRRGSAKLSSSLENAYLAALEQSLVDFAEAANVRVVDTVGECVIKVGAGFVNVDLAPSSFGKKSLAEMTLVIEYHDSVTRQSLLRYKTKERLRREPAQGNQEEEIQNSFAKMIDEIDIISALRMATAIPSSPRPGCKGELIRAGLSNLPAAP